MIHSNVVSPLLGVSVSSVNVAETVTALPVSLGVIRGAVLPVSNGSPWRSGTRNLGAWTMNFRNLNCPTVHETVAMVSIIDTILTVSFLLMVITKRLTLL